MCSLEKRGKVYVLTLVGEDEEHRLNPTTFHAIAEALKEVEESPDAAALVTTNEGKHFSCGIDMKWVAESPLDRMDIAMEGLAKMLAAFMRLIVPTVAAICGGAEAGAFILALAQDYRFMSSSSSSSFPELYMLELDNGLPIPRSMMALISSKLSPAALRDVVLRASKLKAQTAVDCGWHLRRLRLHSGRGSEGSREATGQGMGEGDIPWLQARRLSRSRGGARRQRSLPHITLLQILILRTMTCQIQLLVFLLVAQILASMLIIVGR